MYDAGIFLKNYLDFVEEIPNEIQKCITKCREVDYKTKNLISDVQKMCDKKTTQSDKKASLKMQQILVKITELKDEKIQLSQTLSSHIENRLKIVTDSYQQNLVVKQERSPTPKSIPTSTIQQTTNNTKQTQNSPNPTSTTNIPPESQEKTTKRVRKTRIDNLDVDLTDDNLLPPAKTIEKSLQASGNATKRGSTANSAKKAKKRKPTKKQLAQSAQEALDEVIQEEGITDETTYCICQQISYGEMIFCENDGCKIEWFHFSCVDLTAKPKGRWFCPQCRGDKPNVINKNLRKKQQESSI
ncbi:inhibitor of growth protein 1-like [Chironomus tepperi]|uniref:inhibitor of growth protein 1-like n=1 Tax=Chironomus tepperi TaxID=113505 RepID=UPI00391F75A6